jgi:hypothetical protein
MFTGAMRTSRSRAASAGARRLTRAPDITAIVGQHENVVQPIRTQRKLVVFGEGNLISNPGVELSACWPTASQDGMIALLTIMIRCLLHSS